MAVLNLRSSVFVERANMLEQVTRGLLDRGQDGRRCDGFLDHDGKVALHGRKAWKGLGARDAGRGEQRLDIDLECHVPAVELCARAD